MRIMPTIKQRITPFLWFDTQAEQAARFYTSLFENSRIKQISRYGKAGREVHGKEPGSVLTVEFEIDGMTFVALNGGPQHKFSEAMSFQVTCETQAEIDHFWSKLSDGGEEGPCGWLKDKYGLSWQIVPAALGKLMGGKDSEKSKRVMQALMKMTKIDIKVLEQARLFISEKEYS
jgi:predicted 3-demethylubiquinone-9 3-methyltransferase (glyoxalase superfamily)